MKIARIKSESQGIRSCCAILRSKQALLLEGDILEGIRPTSLSIDTEAIDAFLPPVDPPNIIAIGRNYAGHAAESNVEPPERPAIFLKATSALSRHMAPIVLPEVAPDEVDYEAELGVVIGKTAREVPREKALDYVLGYCCANDVSARDCQKRLDIQWARAKSFDSFAPIGPWIETELDPSALKIRSMLNGKVMQDSNTSHMIFPVDALISYISHSMTLLPGTVIFTGTPEGVGMARNPQVFLRPGDNVSVEIEGIGTLMNPVCAP